MFCCGPDETKAKKGAGVASLTDNGNFELDKDHAEYLEKSKAKTQEKNNEIQKAYQKQQSGGTDEEKATARFWFEFHNKITERLEQIRQIGKTDEVKEGEEAPDPKAEHEKFLKEINFELEEPLLRIFAAYSKVGDDGDRKINKEASMRFFDDFVNVNGDMCLASAQDYSRYCLKFHAQQDSSLQDSKKEAADAAEKAAIKQAKADAAEKEMKGAKKENLSGLERAIKNAEEVEADVEEAKAKLAELKEQKEKADAKSAEIKQKKADDAAKAKENMSDDQKAKEEAEQKKKDEFEAICKEKKEEAEKILKEAVEAAGEDMSALQVAITNAKKNSNKPDTTAAEEKMAELQMAAADKTIKDAARTAAEENFLLGLNSHIDSLIRDWTTAIEEVSPFTIKKEAFEKFFNGENGPGAADYELQRDYLVKVLEVGTGEGFEGFIQGLGFKVLESDCVEEVKKMNEKKEDA